MQRAHSIAQIAKSLGFSTARLRTVIGQRKLAPSQETWSRVGKGKRQAIKPWGSLRTLQGSLDPALQIETSEKDENKIYEQWRTAAHPNRTSLEKQLFNVVRKHAAAVVWSKLPEDSGQLARDIASDVLAGLHGFEGRSKFSTWVHSIALNKTNKELQRIILNRDRFEEFEEHQGKGESRDTEDSLNARFLRDHLAKGLSPEKVVLLDGLIENASNGELATKLKITVDALESRKRRLLVELRQKLDVKRRK